MKTAPPPRFDTRRTAEFAAELLARARAWVPEWGLTDGEADFGRALLEIAARFSSDVAERLDRAGDKLRRGFLDWLAVRGKAARPARVPAVFKLADSAKQDVDALAPIRLQADADGTSVVFETEKDLRIIRGALDVVVGVDAAADGFYLPAPGLSDLKPIDSVPTQWSLKSFAAIGGTKLQLDPETGLIPEILIEIGGHQYRIVQADKGIVTIDPPLDADVAAGTRADKVTTFAPFDGAARNRQVHALYLGHMDLLNIEAAATIDVVGASVLGEGFTWQYWGKVDGQADEDGWQPLELATVNRPGAVVLNKSKGAVDPRKIGETNSRWIRAYSTKVDGAAPVLSVDALELRINYQPTPPPCPAPAGAVASSPAAEALASTTPIVLDSPFFPLGKEPKQFDAFYLGSQEAFSKKAAKVQLCFEMADPTFFSLSAVRNGQFANRVLAGVAKDGALHLLAIDPASGAVTKFLNRDPLQPPAPGYDGQATSGPAVVLDSPFPPIGTDAARHWRLPVWTEVDFTFLTLNLFGFLVGVSAGDAIWAWHEHSVDRHKSGWISFGSLPPVSAPATSNDPVVGLVYLADPSPASVLLVALRAGQILKRLRADGSAWQKVDPKDGTNAVNLQSIVPVLDAPNGFATSVANGMVGVSAAQDLYSVDVAGACTLLAGNADIAVRPIAVKSGPDLIVAFAKKSSPPEIVVYHSAHGLASLTLETGAELQGFEVTSDGGKIIFIASVLAGGAGYVASWEPQTAPTTTLSYLRSSIPAGVGFINGVPTEISHRLVIPGSRGDALIATFDPSKRFSETASLQPGVVLPASAPALALTDVVTRMNGAVPEEHAVMDYGKARDGEVLYEIAAAFSAGVTGPLLAYKASSPLTGKKTAAKKLELQAGDHDAILNSFLRVDVGGLGSYFQIVDLDRSVEPWVAKVDSALPAGPTLLYVKPIPTAGRTAPFMKLSPPASGNWPASLLARVQLLFPGADPELQSATAFEIDGAAHPTLVALGQEFTTPPAVSPAPFVVDASLGDWSHILEDTSANPELSWEYSNGKGWWKLPVTLDDTQNLKTSGALQFEIPDDIAASDWAGKTNFWIRARLIGGDYGQPKVTVHTKDLGGGESEQTVDRSSDGVRPPSVLRLGISYSVSDGVMPTFVLAEDSGSIRDQSEANRTAGAIVEAFVPIAVALGRLSTGSKSSEATQPCPPDCACDGASAVSSTGRPATATQVSDGPPMTGRALLVGLDAVPEGAPINVLIVVDAERNHDAFAPLTVEALIADRFVPIVTGDATRGLGESGLLQMSFAVAPTRRELFGKTLTWLRLTPAATAGAVVTDWKPAIRGAYLNAVWASAAETMTRELLGSSDGAPNLMVSLARPPVLQDTLELRVMEPLGEEERTTLRQGDPSRVLNDVDGLPGDWVRWEAVIDPGDEAADARVYAIDEANGTVRFGDGLHGMIPPIGTDSIVAFSYRRTEPPKPGSESTAPGNLIGPRAALNLVSPIDGVESVTAADQAAGGAPPESDDRVLRFGFARQRHRGRAVTGEDLEDIALESSRDIVQARRISRTGSVRLVIVMRGDDPIPTAAQVRELRRLLLDVAPTSLSAPHALEIAGPVVRKLRVELQLRVPTLDDAGGVSNEVKKRMASLFDTAGGGTDHDGWPLGADATPDDIAIALVDTPNLESIEEVTLVEVTDDGDRPWPGGVKSGVLVMLDDDPVRFQFEAAEVAV